MTKAVSEPGPGHVITYKQQQVQNLYGIWLAANAEVFPPLPEYIKRIPVISSS